MNKKIRVLQFPIANSKGGITQYVLRNWKMIDKSRFQFDFATMSDSLDFANELEKQGCKIYYISCYAEENEKKFISEFKKILIDGNYDIVHLHTKHWKSFSVERIAKEVGIKKIIVHAHSTGIDGENVQSAEKLHYQMRNLLTEDVATDYWACSKLAADFLFGKNISTKKIRIMNNAIDLNKFRYNCQIRELYRKKLGVEKKFVIGNVGRFAYPKNQEFLLKIFKEICTLQSNCILLLIGTGEKEKEFRQYVSKNGIIDKVLFLGYREDVHCILQAMDVFALTSEFEGMPLVLIEAQMAGLKCLCSNTITDEVLITKNIQQLPLEIECWKKEILNLLHPYERKDMTKEVEQAGYNIVCQIKELEKGYCSR